MSWRHFSLFPPACSHDTNCIASFPATANRECKLHARGLFYQYTVAPLNSSTPPATGPASRAG